MEELPYEAYYHRIGRNICRLRREKEMAQEALTEASVTCAATTIPRTRNTSMILQRQ